MVVTEFSAATRRAMLGRAAENVFDVAVIGGGITGAGVAREAALRGLSVVLLERGDYASGTSSRSSKLIHGGLRYLAQGDLGLVREAARERAVLRRMAPHLARPTTMLVPVRSRSGQMKLRAGLWTYARLAGAQAPESHRSMSRSETLAAEPSLDGRRIAGSVAFTEYATDDARLTLETVLSAVAAGAVAANYAEVVGCQERRDGVGLVVEDRIGGQRLVVRARVAVNAAGPWLEATAARIGCPGAPPLELTRGIHLCFPRDRLPVRQALVLPAPDGRATFIVPAGKVAYLGTTDTAYRGAPDEPGLDEADVEYLIASAAAVLQQPPRPHHAIGVWAGVRPLVQQPGKAPSEISRRDEVRVGPGPIVTVAGGKLTTYRRMAERVLEKVAVLLGKAGFSRGGSTVPLVGGDEAAQRRARRDAARLGDRCLEERLWATYGQRAASLVAVIARDPSAAEPVGGLEELTKAELDFFVRNEMALTVDDVLRRRCRVAMFDVPRALAAADAVADGLAAYDGTVSWTCEQWRAWRKLLGGQLDVARGSGSKAAEGCSAKRLEFSS